TQEEAANQLGLPIGTVRSRLARGRELLRKRLAAGGVVLSGAALTTLGLSASASADLSKKLLENTARAALAFAAGAGGRTPGPANAAALAEGSLKYLWTAKLRLALALILTLAVVVTGAAFQQSSGTLPSSPSDGGAEAGSLPADLGPATPTGSDDDLP